MCKNIRIMKLKEIYKKEPFHIMDCTLRDGSYAINFNFTKQDTLLISKHLDNLNIPYIEVLIVGSFSFISFIREGVKYSSASILKTHSVSLSILESAQLICSA